MHAFVIMSVPNTPTHPPSLWRCHNPRCPSFPHPEGTRTRGQGRGWVPVRRCLDRSTCSLPDCVWEGEPYLARILKPPQEVLPPQLVLSSLSCHHGNSCQGLPGLLRSGCGRLPSLVASRHRESWGKGRLPPQCRLSAVTGLVLGPLLSPNCSYNLYMAVLGLVGGFNRKLELEY